MVCLERLRSRQIQVGSITGCSTPKQTVSRRKGIAVEPETSRHRTCKRSWVWNVTRYPYPDAMLIVRGEGQSRIGGVPQRRLHLVGPGDRTGIEHTVPVSHDSDSFGDR